MSRLSALVRLWGDALVLHPDLADPERALAWEEALPAAIDAARNRTLADAAGGLLALLDDPDSRLKPGAPPPAPPAAIGPSLAATGDNISLVTLGDPASLARSEARAVLKTAALDIVHNRRGVIDLRGGAPHPALLDALVEPWRVLAPTPPERYRIHTGFVSEDRPDSGGFGSVWALRMPALAPTASVAVLVDKATLLPAPLLALRALGGCWIVAGSEEADRPLKPVGATRQAIPLGEGLTAWLRVGAIPIDTRPDRIVGPGEDSLTVALTLLRQPPPARSAPVPPAFPPGIVPAGDRERRDGRVGGARVFTLVRHFHPYRARLAPSWEVAADAPLEAVLTAGSERDASLALRRLLVGLRDGHALVRGRADSDVIGDAVPPVRLRQIEGRPAIVRLTHPLARALDARVGDELLTVDGAPVAARIARLEGLLSAGTTGARRLYALNRLLAGRAGTSATVTVRGADGRRRELLLPRDPNLFPQGPPPERDGAAIRTLAGGIVYLDLDKLGPAQAVDALGRARRAPALIVDGRGRTNETIWALAPFLALYDRQPAARFDCPMVAAPAFLAGGAASRTVTVRMERGPWRYQGRVVYLVDERTQSQSELTGLFLAACGASIVGLPTAGCLGDVTDCWAGAGVRASFSGQSIRWPDGREVQGVGLPLTRRAVETLAGIRAGREEVLGTALSYLGARRR